MRSVDVVDLVPDPTVIGTDLPETADIVFAELPSPLVLVLDPIGGLDPGTPDTIFDPSGFAGPSPDLVPGVKPVGRSALNPEGRMADRGTPLLSFVTPPSTPATLVRRMLGVS